MFAGYGSCIFGYVCFDGLLFLFGCSLTCSSFWNYQFGDLGYVCLGGLTFFSLWLYSHVLQFLELPICRSWLCVLPLAILSCALVFWNCQFGDLGYYVCFGGLLFLVPLSLSLWLFSHMLQLFCNCQFGEPLQVHKSFRHSRFQESKKN